MLHFRLTLLVAMLFCVLPGCSPRNPNSPATVSGHVTYKGAAVPAGFIILHSEDQSSYSSPLGTDGSYQILDVPTGKMVVTVETESVNPNKKKPGYGDAKGAKQYAERLAAEGNNGAAAAKAPPEQYLKIPAKYADPKGSPLNAELAAGTQVKDFNLTD